jgi:hypothetical protein
MDFMDFFEKHKSFVEGCAAKVAKNCGGFVWTANSDTG